MKVKELIAILKEYPEEAQVRVHRITEEENFQPVRSQDVEFHPKKAIVYVGAFD